jgi:hypothetical protein
MPTILDFRNTKHLGQKKAALKAFGNTKKLKYYIEFSEIKKLIEKTRTNSKTEFVLNINPETPLNMLWHKIHFISGKPRREKYNHILTNEENATQFLENMADSTEYIERMEREETDIQGYTLKEMERYLQTKDSNSVACYDGVTYGIIKNANNNYKELLLKVMNIYWKIGDQPKEWKISKIMPIVKPEKDIYNIKSYRVQTYSINTSLLENSQRHG